MRVGVTSLSREINVGSRAFSIEFELYYLLYLVTTVVYKSQVAYSHTLLLHLLGTLDEGLLGFDREHFY
jgi:hypothetical protein